MPPEKLYRVDFEHRPEYLYAFVTAEKKTYETSVAVWREVSEKCNRNKCGKILVGQNMPEIDVSYFEKYECVNILVSKLLKMNVAFVDKYIKQLELNKFTELVATNRGLSVKVFTDFDEAEKWLLAL